MGFHNAVPARLRRDLKAQRQLGLSKHSPALLCPSVLIRAIRGSQNDFAANDFSASTNEDHFSKSSLWLPVPITKSGERGFRGSFRLFAKPAYRLSKGPTFWLF